MNIAVLLGAMAVATSFVGIAFAQAPPTTVRVAGRVVDSLGDAVAMARVVVTTRGGGIEVARVQADGDGTFVIPRLPRRELVLQAFAPRRIGTRFPLEFDSDPWARFSELPVVLRMVDAVTVRGRITDGKGKPLPDARVTAEPGGERSSWQRSSWQTSMRPWVTADAEGKFEIPAPFGRTIVCAFAPNHRVVVEDIALHDDHTLDFVLPGCPSSDIRIICRGATSDELDWMAFCDDGDFRPDLWQIWPQTREDAAVTFHGVPLGGGLRRFRMYFVPANIENTSYDVPCEPGPCSIEAPTRPWVRDGDPRVELGGRLVGPSGEPIAGVELTRWVSPQQTDVAVTASDGGFRLAIQSQLPSVWIGVKDERYVPVSPRNERHPGDYAFNVFDVPTSAANDLVLVAERAASITGRLLDDARRPMWGAFVELQAGIDERPTDRSVCTLTDRDGRFVLSGLRASSRFAVWLRASSPAAEFATEKLSLRIGETLTLGDIVMDAPNVVEGELPDDGMGSRAGILVYLCRDSSSRAYKFSREAFTDRQGRFRFTGVPDGHYAVRIGASPGRGAEWPVLGDVTVTHGQRVAVGRH